MYAHSPSPSTTSLSDEDDDVNKSVFFPSEPVKVAPARWSSRLHLLSDASLLAAPASAATSLPPEILILVLRYIHSSRDLYHCLLVSRMWCECSVELLWHKPNMVRSATLLKLMRVLAREDTTFLYARFIRRLNFLSIGSDLTDSLFNRFVKCIRLERLTLVNCKQLTDESLCRVLPSCPNLVAVDITGVVETTDRSIVALATACTRLQGINLGGCKQVSPIGILALALHCPLLRRIKLSGVERLDDEAVSALAVSCPLLLEIDLFECQLVTDSSIRDMWIHSIHMREMRISHCKELTDLAFPAPTKPEAVSVDGPNPFPSSAPIITDQLAPLHLNRQFEHLRMLDLTSCSNLTDDAVDGIIANAPKIRNLFLAKCSRLTDAAIESISKLEKHLHYLHLGHCANITDPAIQMLARSCTRLRYIDLANCTLLTDLAVFELATLPKLRRIGLVRVTNLTDEAVYALSNRHATLERIHLSYCERITVVAIHYLLHRLRKLTHLSLTGIPAFRRPELQKFCRQPPKEYNNSQRSAFCVYSGRGVTDLRDFLASIVSTLTDEMAAGDVEELEGEMYDSSEHDLQRFHSAHSAQMDTDGDDGDGTGTVRGPSTSVHSMEYNGSDAVVSLVRANGLPLPSIPHRGMGTPSPRLVDTGRTSRTSTTTASGSRASPNIPDSTSIPSVTSGHHLIRERRIPGRSRGFPQSIAEDLLHNGEASGSSVATNGASSPSGSAAAFYQTYGAGPSSPSPIGAITPELIYAEIGHGRGAAGWNVPVGQNYHSNGTSMAPQADSAAPSFSLNRSISPATRELQESVYTALTGMPGSVPALVSSPHNDIGGGGEGDGRGRKGRRGFGARLTEAGSYLFGRGSSPGAPGGSGTGAGNGSAASRNAHNN